MDGIVSTGRVCPRCVIAQHIITAPVIVSFAIVDFIWLWVIAERRTCSA